MMKAPEFYGDKFVSLDYATGEYIASPEAPQKVIDAVKRFNESLKELEKLAEDDGIIV